MYRGEKSSPHERNMAATLEEEVSIAESGHVSEESEIRYYCSLAMNLCLYFTKIMSPSGLCCCHSL